MTKGTVPVVTVPLSIADGSGAGSLLEDEVGLGLPDAAELRDIVLRHITVHRGVRQTETHLVFEQRTGPGTVASR